MTGTEMLNAVAQLKHYCAFRVVRNIDNDVIHHSPMVLLDVISGLKPALVLFDGSFIDIVDADDVSDDPLSTDAKYLLATSKVLAALLDQVSY